MPYCETAQPSLSSLPTPVWTRATEPTPQQEPITLSEAKRQCGIADGVDYYDTLLASYITAARQQVEQDTGIVAYAGTFTTKLSAFPADDHLELKGIRPVSSVSSITYVDTAGATQTWSSGSYSLETAAVIPYVRLRFGETWPVVRGDINGITITAVAGYATVLALPERFKQAVRFLVNHWFVHRDTVSVGTISPEVSLTYDALIHSLMRSSYP